MLKVYISSRKIEHILIVWEKNLKKTVVLMFISKGNDQFIQLAGEVADRASHILV